MSVHYLYYIRLGGNNFTDHVRSSSEKDVQSWLLSDPLSSIWTVSFPSILQSVEVAKAARKHLSILVSQDWGSGYTAILHACMTSHIEEHKHAFPDQRIYSSHLEMVPAHMQWSQSNLIQHLCSRFSLWWVHKLLLYLISWLYPLPQWCNLCFLNLHSCIWTRKLVLFSRRLLLQAPKQFSHRWNCFLLLEYIKFSSFSFSFFV